MENDKWKVLVHEKNRDRVNTIVENFRKCSRRLGINIGNPIVETFQGNSTQGIIGEFSHMRLNNDLRIILIILDKYSEKSYKEIKRYINCEVGTPSQVVRCENLTKNLSYFTNVLTQMIIKMGSRLFSIEFHQNIKKIVKNNIYFFIKKY